VGSTRLQQGPKYHCPGLSGRMEVLLSWHFKEGVDTATRVCLSIAAYGNKDLDLSRALIAVVPGDKAEVGKYLNELGVVVDGIVNASRRLLFIRSHLLIYDQ
jgi:hypothetical protein